MHHVTIAGEHRAGRKVLLPVFIAVRPAPIALTPTATARSRPAALAGGMGAGHVQPWRAPEFLATCSALAVPRLRARNPLLVATLAAALAAPALWPQAVGTSTRTPAQPNFLFIGFDDMNDWPEPFGGHPQAKTPNFTRLAQKGVVFSNAHTAAPLCFPSRIALLTGLGPWHTGFSGTNQPSKNWRKLLSRRVPEAVTLPEILQRNGYWTAVAGKVFHSPEDELGWDERIRFPDAVEGNNKDLFRATAGVEEFADTKGADWIAGKLRQAHDKPFFLAYGCRRPHGPYSFPDSYFNAVPSIDDILLPPTLVGDLLDTGRSLRPSPAWASDRASWKQKIQTYLAALHYADDMLGRVLSALESSAYAQNTVVVVWSDHGLAMGEKWYLGKGLLWEAVTRVPLIIALPETNALAEHSQGLTVLQPASLLDLYPTLLELAGIEAPPGLDGTSLVPLLRNPDAGREPAISAHGTGTKSYALRSVHHRYIRWGSGFEELYNHRNDPDEFTNLADDPAQAAIKAGFSAELDGWLAERRARIRAPDAVLGTTQDDDLTPVLSVSPAAPSGAEGETLTFTVTLSEASERQVTVVYATVDGTATQGVDYTAASGMLTFRPGETAKAVRVATTADALPEASETFTLALADPSNARLPSTGGAATATVTDAEPGAPRALPNVLFISIDDLNDWIEPLGGHPQAQTPNLARLARRSTLFTHAYAAAPYCNPSRSALLGGIAPYRSGIYTNGTNWVSRLKDVVMLPQAFKQGGYWTARSGKVFHHRQGNSFWDDRWPDNRRRPPDPQPRRKSQNRIPGSGNILWGPVDVETSRTSDAQVADWVAAKLRASHDKPFFLACGIFRPHLPWYVPRNYFDRFPLDSIELPRVVDDDLADVPAAGVRMAMPDGDHASAIRHDKWRPAVQAYLASVNFVDELVGEVLDVLEQSGRAENTIIVLFGDHGFHLGEKQHWKKGTLWEEATRTPLMISVPAGTPGLREGTPAGGAVSSRPVNLLDIFPTLLELAGLEPGVVLAAGQRLDGRSVVPLLRNATQWWQPTVMTHGEMNHAVRSENFRYIRYADGSEELYDHRTDPMEWTNLASDARYGDEIERLREYLPATNAPGPARVQAYPTEVSVANGFDGTYSLVLDGRPDQPVTVTVKVPDLVGTGLSLRASPAELTFTPGNWATAQHVTVSAGKSTGRLPEGPVMLEHAVKGGRYDEANAQEVAVRVIKSDGLAGAQSVHSGVSAYTAEEVAGTATNTAVWKLRQSALIPDDRTAARRRGSPAGIAIWTDRLGYLEGEQLRLFRAVDPQGDESDYVLFFYRESIESGERRYLVPAISSAALRTEAVDQHGRGADEFWVGPVEPSERELIWEGAVPEPGLWHFVAELRGPDATTVVKRVHAKFIVARRNEALNPSGVERVVADELTLRPDAIYRLQDRLTVKDGAALAIEAGTLVRALGTRAEIVVEPGGRIDVQGSREAPVVMTCAAPVGRREPGCWGGLRVLGRAPATARPGPGVQAAAPEAFGGDEPYDSSGTLRYLRVEFAGGGPTGAALSLHGVGGGTRIEHVQVHASLGDGIAFRGGAAECGYCVASEARRYALDWAQGWQGAARHVFVQQGANGGAGVRASGSGPGVAQAVPTLSNVTLVGVYGAAYNSRRAAEPLRSGGSGIVLEKGAALVARNTLAIGFAGPAIEANSSAAAHFVAGRSSFTRTILHANRPLRNPRAQVTDGISAYVEYLDDDPDLLNIRHEANPDPRPRDGSVALPQDGGALLPTVQYVGAFGRWNWLEEWTFFGDEKDYDPAADRRQR